MRHTPRRFTLVLAIAASAALPLSPATADPATKCFKLYTAGSSPTYITQLCIPWPL